MCDKAKFSLRCFVSVVRAALNVSLRCVVKYLALFDRTNNGHGARVFSGIRGDILDFCAYLHIKTTPTLTPARREMSSVGSLELATGQNFTACWYVRALHRSSSTPRWRYLICCNNQPLVSRLWNANGNELVLVWLYRESHHSRSLRSLWRHFFFPCDRDLCPWPSYLT